MIRAAPPISHPPSRTLSVDGEAVPKHLGHSVLEAVRLQGRDCINTLFAYELVLRTREDIRALDHDAANWDLDSFIGKPLSCRIRLDGQLTRPARPTDDRAVWRASGCREINGIVVSADLWGDDGDQAQYRLVLRPTLFRTTLVVQSRTFIDLGVDEILRDVLTDIPRVTWRLRERYPRLEYQAQYNESDFAFLERLCQEWGINYYFTHAEGRHTLVLTDTASGFAYFDNQDYHRVAYHAPGWKTEAEYLHKVSLDHHLVHQEYRTDDHDYTIPGGHLRTEARSLPRDGPAFGVVDEWHGGSLPTHYAQPAIPKPDPLSTKGLAPGDTPYDKAKEEAYFFGKLRLEALRTGRRRLQAGGNLRAMVPGCLIDLADHPHEAANATWLIVETQFLMEETAQRSQSGGDKGGKGGQWRVQVELVGHPETDALRPVPIRPKPFVHGPQSAEVVGPAGETFHTDALGRIRVRFRWDRSEAARRNGSGWIRVASPTAGNGRGAVSVPRIGEEVLIDFIGGDPDLPICIGSVYNQHRQPPWRLAQEQVLSGVRTQEVSRKAPNYGHDRGNHLVFDDTEGAIQVQLKSDYQASQLSLGRIHRIEDRKGRKDARGDGFELRTDAHGALRAGLGLILSTHARQAAAGGMNEIQESLDLLMRAQAQLQSHARAAVDLQAQEGTDQQPVADRIAAQNAEMRGGSDKPLGEFDAAHLLAASSAGVVVAAEKDVHIAAREHIALSSLGHTSISTGASLLASAGKAIRMVAHRGMRLFAAQGDLEVQAQNADLRLTAKHTAALVSNDGWVNVTAKEGIRLSVGGTCLEITAAQIALLTEGRIDLHAATFNGAGPDNRAAQINRMPKTSFDDRYRLRDPQGRVLTFRAWKARREDGSELGGTSDADGFIDLQRGDGPDGWHFISPDAPQP